MADRREQAENAMSALMRFATSMIMPLWALAMVVIGIEHRSLWWIGCGVVVGAISALLLVGNPLAAPLLDDRLTGRPDASLPKGRVRSRRP